MKSKIIYQPAPIDMTTAHIHSDIEWGNDKQNMLTFIIEDGIIVSADSSIFNWTIGKTIKEVEDYIQAKEKNHSAYQKEIHEGFLTQQQEDILRWEEEDKKERTWKEAHWVCVEGGEGYYDCRN